MVKALTNVKQPTKKQLSHSDDDEATDVANSVGLDLLTFSVECDDSSVTFIIDSVDNEGSLRFLVDFVDKGDSERFLVEMLFFCISPESPLSR